MDFETKYYLSVKLFLRWRSRGQKLVISDSIGKLDHCSKKISCLLEIRRWLISVVPDTKQRESYLCNKIGLMEHASLEFTWSSIISKVTRFVLSSRKQWICPKILLLPLLLLTIHIFLKLLHAKGAQARRGAARSKQCQDPFSSQTRCDVDLGIED